MRDVKFESTNPIVAELANNINLDLRNVAHLCTGTCTGKLSGTLTLKYAVRKEHLTEAIAQQPWKFTGQTVHIIEGLDVNLELI